MPRGRPGFLVFIIAATAGCANYLGPQQRVFPACSMFSVPAARFTLTSEGDSIGMGDVTLLIPAGAVNGPATVDVSRGTTKRNSAAVNFAPAGASSVAFSQPVRLRISYARCPSADFVRPVIYRVDGGRQERRPSEARTDSRYIEATLNTLSEYAVAVE